LNEKSKRPSKVRNNQDGRFDVPNNQNGRFFSLLKIKMGRFASTNIQDGRSHKFI